MHYIIMQFQNIGTKSAQKCKYKLIKPTVIVEDLIDFFQNK